MKIITQKIPQFFVLTQRFINWRKNKHRIRNLKSNGSPRNQLVGFKQIMSSFASHSTDHFNTKHGEEGDRG